MTTLPHLDSPLERALASPVEAQLLAALHDRLVADAAAQQLLDLVYTVVTTPVGPLLLASTEVGLVRVAFASEDHDAVLESLARTVSPRVVRSPAALAAVSRQLDQYFAGSRRTFDVSLDLRFAHGFRRGVLEHLRDIPYGHTESYAAVAAAAGSPRAVRAVGSACATNPLPVVVPCHRVVRSDGGLGGYLGGIATKEFLLGLESAA
jgi:methylated-DNA-[protein]-cysteine S-methyltransferase